MDRAVACAAPHVRDPTGHPLSEQVRLMMRSDDTDRRRARAVRTALLLGAAALLVYATFIFMQYQRSHGLM